MILAFKVYYPELLMGESCTVIPFFIFFLIVTYFLHVPLYYPHLPHKKKK